MGKTKQLNPEIFKAQQVINCVDYTLEEMASDIFTNAKHYANENDCIITDSIEVAFQIFKDSFYSKTISYYFNNGVWILSLEFYTPGNEGEMDAGEFNYIVKHDKCNFPLNTAITFFNNPLAFVQRMEEVSSIIQFEAILDAKAWGFLCNMLCDSELLEVAVDAEDLCLTQHDFPAHAHIKELGFSFFHIYPKTEDKNAIIKELI